MAVKLRLRRMGKKKQPIYKLVAADSHSPRDGKFIEAVGVYNPKTDPATIEVNDEAALRWLDHGAIPTVTAKNILSKAGVLLKRELLKKGLSAEEADAKVQEWKAGKNAKAAEKIEKKNKQKPAEVKKEDKVEESAPEVKGTTSEESV